MKLFNLLIIILLFTGCDHPEGKNFERNKKVTTSLEEIESKKRNTKENSTFAENNTKNVETTDLPMV